MSLQDYLAIVASILGPIGTFMGFMWHHSNIRFEKVELKMDHKFEQMDEKISNVEKRLGEKIDAVRDRLAE